MIISENLLMLAGFVFAHAAWNMSDLSEDELLVPMAMLEKSGERQLLRFEAETQEEAIEKGKATLKTNEKNIDAWAYAQEGQVLINAEYVDVLIVEAKASEMNESIMFIQQFQPFFSGLFKLIGKPLVLIGGNEVSEDEENELITGLNEGVKSHEGVSEFWPQWVES